MNSRIRLRAGALLVVLALPAAAAAQTPQALAERLYRQSGMETQFAAMPAQFVASITTSRDRWDAEQRLPESFTGELATSVARAFDVARFRETVVGHLGQELDGPQMQRVLDWLDSPAGARMTALEKGASRTSTEEYAAYARSLTDTPPPARYVEQVKSLLRATRAIDATVEAMLMMQVGVVSAAVAASPDATPDALAGALARLDSMRPRIAQMVGNHVAITFLHTYRDAAAADLDAYVEFTTSPAGDAYHRAAFEGMALGLRVVSLDVGRAVAALVERLLVQRRT